MFIYNSTHPVTNIQPISRNYQAQISDDILYVDASGGAVTITLPSAAAVRASGNVTPISVIKIDSSANAVTIAAAAGNTVNGASSVSIANQYGSVILTINQPGTLWYSLSVAAGGSAAGAAIFSTHMSASQTISSLTPTILKYDTVDIDTASGYNAGTYTYTAPLAGYYFITANGDQYDNSSNGGASGLISVYKNGSVNFNSGYGSAANINSEVVSINALVQGVILLAAGDTLQIFANVDTSDYTGSTPIFNNYAGSTKVAKFTGFYLHP